MGKQTGPAQQPPWHQAQLKDFALQFGQPAANHNYPLKFVPCVHLSFLIFVPSELMSAKY